jgi:hypothetical protein
MSLLGGFCYDENKFSQFTELEKELNLQALVSVYMKQEHNNIDWSFIGIDNHKIKKKCILIYEIRDIIITDKNGEEKEMPIEEKCEFVVKKSVEYDNQLEELKSQLLHSIGYCDEEAQQANKQLLKIVMRILTRQIKVIEDIENYKKVLLEELERYEELVEKDNLLNVTRIVVGPQETQYKYQKTNQGTYIEIAEAMKEQLETLYNILSHFQKCDYWNVEINDLPDFTDLLLGGLNYSKKK